MLDENKKQSLEEMIAETMKEKQLHETANKSNTETHQEMLKFKYYEGGEGEHHHHSSGEHHHHHHQEKKEKKKARIVLISVLIFFFAIVLVVGGFIYHYISLINIKTDEDEILDSIEVEYTKEPNSPQNEVDKLNDELKSNFNKDGLLYSDKIYNILLLGTDSRNNDDRGRSDSMMVLSLNTVTKEINITSFLRDMYVTIPGKGNSRLNHAYAYGGATLTMDTIEQNFKFRIDSYAQINFYNFVEVIDAVGGVDIDLTDEEVEYMRSYLKERQSDDGSIQKGGRYHLNGEQALAYSRIRYIGTDFGRTERQRTVLEKVIEKASQLSVGELNDFVETFLPKITTNISKTKLLSLVLKSPAYFKYARNKYRVPIDDTFSYMTINHMSVLGVDINKNKEYLFDKLYHFKENSKDNDKSVKLDKD